MKKTHSIICFMLILLMLVGCSEQSITKKDIDPISKSYYPITITDKFGNEITINEMPKRVISFSPELVEIMFELEVEDTLIGRSVCCDYPEEAQYIPDMGDLFNLNLESIIEGSPDLILLSSMAGEEIVKTLQEQGLKVLVLDFDTTVEGTYAYIHAIGKIFNIEERGDALVNRMKKDIQVTTNKVDDLYKPTAYFVIGYGEYDSTATGDTYISELMEMAGSINVASDGSKWMYSIEQLIEKDPYYLICSKYYDAKNQIINTSGYKDLTAVKEGRLYEVDENIFYRQGPRMVEAIEELAQLFHPEAFMEE